MPQKQIKSGKFEFYLLYIEIKLCMCYTLVCLRYLLIYDGILKKRVNIAVNCMWGMYPSSASSIDHEHKKGTCEACELPLQL